MTDLSVLDAKAAASGSAAAPHTVPGRACGSCTLCCKVVGVLEAAKPAGVWCPHCVSGRRCTIYATRYASCRSFYCQWMIEPGLGSEWKPERAKFALVKTTHGRHLTACVDPGFPSAWRRSPYYENLKRWAAEGARRSPDLYLVDVMIGSRWIAILPDRDVDIGHLAPDEMIELQRKRTAAGERLEVRKVKRVDSSAPPTFETIVSANGAYHNPPGPLPTARSASEEMPLHGPRLGSS
jgi:hypothetical protein